MKSAFFSILAPGKHIPKHYGKHKGIIRYHLALKVPSHEALETLAAKLQTADGVEIEFSPEALGETPLRHMMTTIPGGVRVEFIAAPA